MTHDEANTLIGSMRCRRLPCTPCMRMLVHVGEALPPVPLWMPEPDALVLVGETRFVKHDPACDGGKAAYPWANKLTAEKVAEYATGRGLFDLAELERLVTP